MKIFISYRRKDSAREIGRIRDRLKAAFGEQNVFRDLVDIPSGVDFRTVLERETNDCDVMLVIIGPLWAGITDDEGNKRLFNAMDWTRIEVETGLINIIVQPAIFDRYRPVVVGEPFLLIEGILQQQEGVTSIRAERVAALGRRAPAAASHDFH